MWRGPPSGAAFALRTTYSPNFVLVLEKLNNSSPKTLHSVVILFLVLSLSTSLLSSGFTFYNSLSNPYQTFLGPVGVYTWSGLGGEYGPRPGTCAGAPARCLSPCVALSRTNTQSQLSHRGRAGSLHAVPCPRGWGLLVQIYSIA